MPEGEAQINTSMRKAILPEPKAVVYPPDSLQGIAQKAERTLEDAQANLQKTKDRYLNGADPLIKTKPEEEAKQK